MLHGIIEMPDSADMSQTVCQGRNADRCQFPCVVWGWLQLAYLVTEGCV